MGTLRSLLTGGLVGAAIVYYLEPEGGARRRKVTRDRAGALKQRLPLGSSGPASSSPNQTGTAHGTASHRRDNPNPDDNTLRDRVESELFRSPEVPKGEININVADGIVELRGQLPQQEDINLIVERVRRVPDVKNIHNYLHLPGTVAPNKAEVERVS